MRVVPTPLAGLVLLELDVFVDPRGRFVETYRRDRYRELGITAELVQDNFVSSARGTLRGLHYQRTRPQGKLIHVTRGEVFDVTVDLRDGSPTRGKWFGTVLSADNLRQLWIPPGFAHGYLAVSEVADLSYKVTTPYAPDDEQAIRWDDPELAIQWPITGAPILSARDQEAPAFRDAPSPVVP